MVNQKASRTPLSKSITWQTLLNPWRFLFILILVIGIFFRFANIDRKIFWFDENATILKISGYTSQEWNNILPSNQLIDIENLSSFYLPKPESNVIDTVKLLSKEDSKHSPLYFVMLRLWVDLFGNSVAVMRSLSALISLLVFPCLYWLCLELFQRQSVGWMGVALIAVSPFHLLYAQEARMYSLQMVTVLLSSAVLLRAIRVNTKLNWGLYALSLSLSIYTHTLSLFVAVAHGFYVVATYGIRKNKVLVGYLAATLLSLLAFSPWIFSIITNSDAVVGSMSWSTQEIPLFSLLKHSAINLSRIFIDFTPGYRLDDSSGFDNPIMISLILIVLILVGYSIYFIVSNNQRKIWVFILSLIAIPSLFLILPDVLSGGIRSLNNRYLVASYLGIHLAVAHLLATKMVLCTKIWQQKFWQNVTLVVLGCGIISCAIISPAQTWWNKYYSSDILPIAKIVNQANRPLLVVENYWRSGWNLYSFSNFLEPKVKILALNKGNMAGNIPEYFSDVYLFNPSEVLQEKLKKSQKYQIQPVYNTDTFQMMEIKTVENEV